MSRRAWPSAMLFEPIPKPSYATAIIVEGYDLLLLTTHFTFPCSNEDMARPKHSKQPISGSCSVAGEHRRCALPLEYFMESNRPVYQTVPAPEKYLAFPSRVLLGYKKTMIASLVAVSAFIFILFFTNNLIALEVGELLCGIPWVVFQHLPPPTHPRFAQLCYMHIDDVCKSLLGNGSIYCVWSSTLDSSSTRSVKLQASIGRIHCLLANRIPFAIQWIWAVPIVIRVFLVPRSPRPVECFQTDRIRWLVRRSRDEDAKQALRRLTSSKHADVSFKIHDAVVKMVTTNELEKAIVSGVGYIDCFKGGNLRRTEIIQNLSGSAFIGYSTYLHEQASLPVVDAFRFHQHHISYFPMHHFDRRTLPVFGLYVLTILLFLIGFISLSSSNAASWAIGSRTHFSFPIFPFLLLPLTPLFPIFLSHQLTPTRHHQIVLLLYTLLYNLTVRPLTYALISELPSTRLKSKTISLARILYNIITVVDNIIMQNMLNLTSISYLHYSLPYYATYFLLTHFPLTHQSAFIIITSTQYIYPHLSPTQIHHYPLPSLLSLLSLLSPSHRAAPTPSSTTSFSPNRVFPRGSSAGRMFGYGIARRRRRKKGTGTEVSQVEETGR
ncbi:Sugar porter family MFS transporter protein [Rutstroemia sp. NJR-2017a BVV2]|nr:Sugar porter family MFS transporter protein [Rutstroemia sp. NJR-2017a BVV2]